MSWMDESQNNSGSTDTIWLRFPQQVKNIGDRTEVRMRIIAGDPDNPGTPAGVWVHWFQGKPFNCGGRGCPACDARKKMSLDEQKNFPMRTKQFFNVLVDEGGRPVVKVYSFGYGVSKDLKSFAEKYGDLRNYDVTVRKEQLGRLSMNVGYDVFYEGVSPLTEAQKDAAQSLHDLSQFTKPATQEELQQIAKGVLPGTDKPQEITVEQMERGYLISEIKKAIPADLDLKSFGVYDDTSNEKLESLLNSLKGA